MSSRRLLTILYFEPSAFSTSSVVAIFLLTTLEKGLFWDNVNSLLVEASVIVISPEGLHSICTAWFNLITHRYL
jgi:hypothetical protein